MLSMLLINTSYSYLKSRHALIFRHVPVDNNIGTPVMIPLPMQDGMPFVPMPMPIQVGGHFPHPAPHMLPHHMAQPPPHMLPHHMAQPPPQMMPQHPVPQHSMPPHFMPHPAQTQIVQQQQQLHHDIPLSILQRIAQEEAADSKDDSPVHIIAREEIIPVFHPAAPEGRALASAPVPAEMVQPPPLPPQYARQMPLTTQLHPANDQSTRPHCEFLHEQLTLYLP